MSERARQARAQSGVPRPKACRTALWCAWLFVALWMAAIFCFSAQTGDASQAQSDGIGYQLLRLVDASFAQQSPAQQAARVESVQVVMRKGAHLLEYALLGALLYNALRRTRGLRRASIGDADTGGAGIGANGKLANGSDLAASKSFLAQATTARPDSAAAATTPRRADGIPTAVALPRKAIPCALLAVAYSALYAVSDEWHQSFVPARSAQLVDVCIDTVGALLGVMLWIALCAGGRACKKLAKCRKN